MKFLRPDAFTQSSFYHLLLYFLLFLSLQIKCHHVGWSLNRFLRIIISCFFWTVKSHQMHKIDVACSLNSKSFRGHYQIALVLLRHCIATFCCSYTSMMYFVRNIKICKTFCQHWRFLKIFFKAFLKYVCIVWSTLNEDLTWNWIE